MRGGAKGGIGFKERRRFRQPVFRTSKPFQRKVSVEKLVKYPKWNPADQRKAEKVSYLTFDIVETDNTSNVQINSRAAYIRHLWNISACGHTRGIDTFRTVGQRIVWEAMCQVEFWLDYKKIVWSKL